MNVWKGRSKKKKGNILQREKYEGRTVDGINFDENTE